MLSVISKTNSRQYYQSCRLTHKRYRRRPRSSESWKRNYHPPTWATMRRPCSRRRSRASIQCSRTRLSVARVVEFRMARQTDETYIKDIEAMRREKDFFFKEEHESPIPHGLRDKFSGLAYFPVNPKNRIRSRLVRAPNPQRVVLATSRATPRDMKRLR